MTPSVLSRTRFFFNDTATTEIYTLSLHDALPILLGEDLIAYRDTQGRVGLLREHSRSEEHTSELQSQSNLVCRLLLEKKKIDDAAEAVIAAGHPLSRLPFGAAREFLAPGQHSLVT